MQRYRLGACTTSAWLLVIVAAAGGCSTVKDTYRAYHPRITWGELSLGADDNVKASDVVQPEAYCSALSSRARYTAGQKTTAAYVLSIIGAAAITAGSIWGAVGPDNNWRKGGVVALPAAGALLLPLGTYFFTRARDDSNLAGAATNATLSANPGQACNAALAGWNTARGNALTSMSEGVYKATPKPAEAAEQIATDANDNLDAAAAAADAPTLSAEGKAAAMRSLEKATNLSFDFKSTLQYLDPELREQLVNTQKRLQDRVEEVRTKLDNRQPLPEPTDAGKNDEK